MELSSLCPQDDGLGNALVFILESRCLEVLTGPVLLACSASWIWIDTLFLEVGMKERRSFLVVTEQQPARSAPPALCAQGYLHFCVQKASVAGTGVTLFLHL